MSDYAYKDRTRKMHKNGTRKMTIPERIRNYFRGPQGFEGVAGTAGYSNCAVCLGRGLHRQAVTIFNASSMCKEHFMEYKHD